MAEHPMHPQISSTQQDNELKLDDIPLSGSVSEKNQTSNDMSTPSHSRTGSRSSAMTEEKNRTSGARTRIVSFAATVDPPTPKRSSIYLSPNTAATGPDPVYRVHRRPTIPELPERTKDNDVPARKTFVWISITGILLSFITLALSVALLVLSRALTVLGAAIWNVVAAVIGIPLPILAIYYWRLPNAPSKHTKILQGVQGFLWVTIFVIMCVLGGLREEEDISAGEVHKGIVEYNDHTPQSVETLMIVMAIMSLMGIAQTATAFFTIQKGRYQVGLNNAPPNIRASMLMMQPGTPQQRGGSMSSEYPDCRRPSFEEVEGEGSTDIYAKAAEDYLEMNKVHLKGLKVK